MLNKNLISFLVLTFVLTGTYAQQTTDVKTEQKVEASAPTKKWYESISIRGYVQVRYNRLLETNPDLKCEQCDRSWGDNGGVFLRRTRIIFSGQISKRVYFRLKLRTTNPSNASLILSLFVSELESSGYIIDNFICSSQILPHVLLNNICFILS